jgi:putative ABC transport system substrate-binding protein
MQRREFITLLGGAAAWPLGARAQQAAMPVIGFLSVGEAVERAHLLAAFNQGLNETGFVVDRSVAIEYRWAGDQFDRLPGLASELVSRQVTVILAASDYAASAAKSATTTTPIIFVIGSDPIRLRLVDSLNRPGNNLTGMTWISADLLAKRLQLLHDLVPSGQIAILSNSNSPDSEFMKGLLQAAARSIRQQLIVIETTNNGDLDAIIANVAASGAGALLIVNDPFFNNRRHQLVALVARHRLPTMYDLRLYVEAGGLLSYGASQPDAYRQAGTYVGRVLRGEKPADLPVMLPTKFELIFNLKTAKALGLTVPPSLLARADEVIE